MRLRFEILHVIHGMNHRLNLFLIILLSWELGAGYLKTTRRYDGRVSLVFNAFA